MWCLRKKKSSRKRPWLGAVIEDAPLVSLHIATSGIGLGCSTHDASNGGQGLNLGLGDLHCCQILSMDVGGTSLFLDRYNRERMVNGLGVVGGVHSLHEIFGVSGTAPGSMYRMADGIYDGRMLAEIAAGAMYTFQEDNINSNLNLTLDLSKYKKQNMQQLRVFTYLP